MKRMKYIIGIALVVLLATPQVSQAQCPEKKDFSVRVIEDTDGDFLEVEGPQQAKSWQVTLLDLENGPITNYNLSTSGSIINISGLAAGEYYVRLSRADAGCSLLLGDPDDKMQGIKINNR